MSTTDVTICSNALLLLGHNTIASLDESDVAANLYEPTLKSLLTLHRWRFASAKKDLSRLAATPLNEWSYGFQLPGDLLIVQRTYPNTNYEIYEDKLYCSLTSVAIDYTFQPAEGKFPAYFVELLQLRLAAQFAIPVTDNSSKAEAYNQMYEAQLTRAKFLDSQARPNVGIEHAPFVECRH